jgi:hypothetical protein
MKVEGCYRLAKKKFRVSELVSEIWGIRDFWAHANNFFIYEPILFVF